ncbi:TetR/AcrR family transcriptional regulator [Agromyces ramosus]|uniref:TetR/AcrR family transcriptional repressor of mexCD-oprJ operon n=1 Tax=Agromyces ramosus TaxID=33879 RepID=A0ABU0R6K3_9MICO|nr:TetR/AcrR family transcriptional regulator [Agromyces ramosus]MDQ0893720.1 TetR/AcrR family transcriptional repressor of mexCD-oprJ operon [Agromyces ramosus]
MTVTRAPRSDAVRNRDAILDAAIECLSEDPTASMADIAKAAGVGRVTVYGHFSSRELLLESVLIRTIDRSEADLAGIDLDGDPVAALERLVRRSWRIVETFHRLLGAAEESLSNDRILAHHAEPMARVQGLIARGQRDGAMRRDLRAEWLSACFTAVLHAAAGELRGGRLTEAEADRVVVATVISLVADRTS